MRVLFDRNKRASAVECVPNEAFLERLDPNQPMMKLIRARRMVIICSGALGTPPILERSGIGSPSILERFGIPVISGLSGVGENYQDHHLIQVVYKIQLETEDASLGKRLHLDGIDVAPGIESGPSTSGWNVVDLSSKLRPTASEIEELGPEFQAIWDAEYKNAPEKPLVLMGIVSRYVNTAFSLLASYLTTHLGILVTIFVFPKAAM